MNLVRPVTLASALLALIAAGCGQKDRQPPSIVVVTIDTLRADHLPMYGYFRDTAPNLGRLAEEGVLFERAVTTMATTLPAHVSLWTGRYPLQTGVTRNGIRLRGLREEGRGTRLFAEMLADVGYETAAFVSAVPVTRRTGIDLGFATFDEPEETMRRAPETTERVLRWLAGRPAEPLFLWVHWFDPHHPYDPPEPWASRFGGEPAQREFLERRRLDPTDPEVLANNDGYDGEIALTDAELGRLVDALGGFGLLDRTALVVTSDHGEALGEHGRVGHGEVYNEQLFVPLVMRLPTGSPLNGRRVRHLVSLTDVVPTLVEALDLPISETDRRQFAGVDALASFGRREQALAQHPTRRRKAARDALGEIERFALVRHDWKYASRGALADDAAGELFDLETDAEELTNLVFREGDKAREMRAALLEEIARLSEGGGGFATEDEGDAEVIESLRALGYLD